MHFNVLLTAPIFVLICFCLPSGLDFLFSLNFLFTRGYYILIQVEIVSTRVEIFHVITFFFQIGIPSWNFNPG